MVHGFVSIGERGVTLFDLRKSYTHIISLEIVVEVRTKIFVIKEIIYTDHLGVWAKGVSLARNNEVVVELNLCAWLI